MPHLAGRTAVSRKWVSGMDAAKEAEGQDGPSAPARWSGADVRASCARRRTGQSGRAFLVTFLRGAQPQLKKVTRPARAEQGASEYTENQLGDQISPHPNPPPQAGEGAV